MTRENRAYWSGYSTGLSGQIKNTKGLIGNEITEYLKGFRSGNEDRSNRAALKASANN